MWIFLKKIHLRHMMQAAGRIKHHVPRRQLDALAGVYCELSEQKSKQAILRGLEGELCLTHVGYYDAMFREPGP